MDRKNGWVPRYETAKQIEIAARSEDSPREEAPLVCLVPHTKMIMPSGAGPLRAQNAHDIKLLRIPARTLQRAPKVILNDTPHPNPPGFEHHLKVVILNGAARLFFFVPKIPPLRNGERRRSSGRNDNFGDKMKAPAGGSPTDGFTEV